MARRICKFCESWKPLTEEEKSGVRMFPKGAGKCDRDFSGEEPDGAVVAGNCQSLDGSEVSFFTGPFFGCVHFERAT